jgi:hypothetical protein
MTHSHALSVAISRPEEQRRASYTNPTSSNCMCHARELPETGLRAMTDQCGMACPLNRVAVRNGYRAWIAGGQYSHALTLNPNQGDMGLKRATQLFGRFCLDVDRHRYGRQRVNKLFTAERFDAVAITEKVDTNAHLHVAANFKPTFLGRAFEDSDERELKRIWREATKGSGTMVIDRLESRGWAAYMTKRQHLPDHHYILAADFHPNEKLVQSLSALS